MATAQIGSNLDDAIDVIQRNNPQQAQAYIQRLEQASEREDRAGFDRLASEAIRIAAGMQQAKAKAQSKPAAATRQRTMRILGLAAIGFGLALWVPGAHYQLDGWTLILNAILDLVRSGAALPLASGKWALLLIVFGVVYSIGERRYLPFQRSTGQVRFMGVDVLLVWALINISDLISAYIGIKQPLAPDAWPITQQMARTPWMSIAWMLIVVYIGDVLITIGWRMLGIPVPPWAMRILRWFN